MVTTRFTCGVLFVGKLLQDVSLPEPPSVLCTGPDDMLLIVGYVSPTLWVFSWDGQLRQTISAKQMDVVEGFLCAGVGWDTGRLLLCGSAGILSDSVDRLLYTYRTM